MEMEINNKNSEMYLDPTACEAIKNINDKTRFYKLLTSIFNICELSGFHLEERIVVRDTRTGQVWR